jgi:hypothetical protein
MWLTRSVTRPRTLRRYQQRFAEGGLAALGRPSGYPPGLARLAAARRKRIQNLKTQGCSHHEIARQLGISVPAVRKTLRRLGWEIPAPGPAQLLLGKADATPADSSPAQPFPSSGSPAPGENPNLSAFCSQGQANPPTSQDTDSTNRGVDRLLARLGLLEDAPPLFGSATAVPRAEFCWPCPPWSPAACSSARKRSMAASARPSMDCAPVCSRSC